MLDIESIFRKATATSILDGWYGPHLQPGGGEDDYYTLLPRGGLSVVFNAHDASVYADMLIHSGLL